MEGHHITIRVYPNKDIVYNIVRDEDLEGHVQYNTTWRFGCAFYVDGKRVYNGYLKDECLKEYDKIVEDEYSDLIAKNAHHRYPTIPYR